MRVSLPQVLNGMKSSLGGWEDPRGRAWINFERCPFEDHRKRWVFGINPKKGIFKCMSCGRRGFTKDIGFPADLQRLARRGLAPRRSLVPSEPAPEGIELPWKRLTPRGPMKILERKAVEYLKSRGITRMRAAASGIGYGVDGVWLGYCIHPFFDDDGRTLRGWQGRVQGEPDEGYPKVRTTSALKDGDFIWGAHAGALYLLDAVPQDAPVLVIAEGPYDALSIQRVEPCVALLGSSMSTRQMSRILKKRPKEIIVALDPDKRAEAVGLASRLFKRCPNPVFFVDYPPIWEGDWAAAGNGAVRCADSVYEGLKFFTREFKPGVA